MLCAASPTFKNIFSHDFLEQQTKEVDMTHWDTAVVNSFVKFMYHGKIEIAVEKQNIINYNDENNGNGKQKKENHDINKQDSDVSMENINVNETEATNASVDIDTNINRLQKRSRRKSSEEDSKATDFGHEENECEDELNKKRDISREDRRQEMNFVFELFQMAEFYHVIPLIQACCIKLYENIDINNAFTLLSRMNQLELGKEIEKIRV